MPAGEGQGGGTVYRTAAPDRLSPGDIQARRFTLTRLGRRGLDPDEVHQFLARVAADLAAVYAELATAREETDRVKDALRDWQAQHSAWHEGKPEPAQQQAWPLSSPHGYGRRRIG